MKEENKEMIPTTAAAALVEMLRQYTPEKNHWNSEEPEKVFTSTSYRSMWIIGWPLLEKIASQSREIEELQASKENLIKIAEQFQKNASEITKECFKLKNEITDLKAEIERLKGENFKELESKFRNGC